MAELKKKIVVVEDEADILELINMVLTNAGYEVHLCDNGRDALDLIKKVRPHLVILDLMLPGFDGQYIVKTMSETEELVDTSVMIVSALEDAEKALRGFVQVRDFCIKPFRTSVLLSKVKAIMGDAEN
ncbi:MAG: response regulator [Elusimicrobiota bacterium]|jgi:two-component system alkaline phosphatase synthesis response regulator PhoP|nr:response regulator [Elusimicrobiota bacterium]